jgi:alpha-D-ribose 1-methylphosphonate 5-triphosphate synthase subunit PhnH
MTHRVTKLIAAAATLALAGRASAQLVYEPFSYAAGSTLEDKMNPITGLSWSRMGNPTDDDITATAAGLSYPGLAAATGNAAGYDAAGKSERLAIGPVITSGTAYYSMLFEVTALGAMSTTPALLGGFSNLTGPSGVAPTTVGTRLYLRQASNSTTQAPTFNIGVSKNSSTGTDISFDATAYSINTPIFVVGGYQINGTDPGTDDQSKLYINPNSFGAASPPAATLTAPTAGTDLFNSGPSVAAFVLRQGSANVPFVRVDELRIDRTWAQVTPPTGINWNVDSDGSWSQGAKWSGAASPDSPDAFVNFGSAILAPRTVTVDVPVALRTITFSGGQGYSVIGSQPLNFSASAAINVRSANHVVSAPVSLGGDFLVSVASGSALTVTSDVASNGYAITKSGAGSLEMKNVRAGALSVVGGLLKITPNGGSDATGRVSALSMTATSQMDLCDNDLVVDFVSASPIGSWNGTSYSGVTGLIASGLNNGAWNGKSLITSQPAALAGETTLGVADAATVLSLSSDETALWSGQIIDSTTVLVRYTYAGDANLNGVINADDYALIDLYSQFAGSSGFSQGDFNYDGAVNADDYALIDVNVMRQGASLGGRAGLTAVPEPVMIGVLPMIFLAARCRRRARGITS